MTGPSSHQPVTRGGRRAGGERGNSSSSNRGGPALAGRVPNAQISSPRCDPRGRTAFPVRRPRAHEMRGPRLRRSRRFDCRDHVRPIMGGIYGLYLSHVSIWTGCKLFISSRDGIGYAERPGIFSLVACLLGSREAPFSPLCSPPFAVFPFRGDAAASGPGAGVGHRRTRHARCSQLRLSRRVKNNRKAKKEK